MKGEDLDGEPVPLSSKAPSSFVNYVRGEDGEVLPEDPDDVPQTKEDGLERWRSEMTFRFLRGEDEVFDYKAVDEDGGYDEIESQEAQARWFDDQEPEWEGDVETVSGETGIQDF